MNITQYIKSKPELAVLNFATVYKTIITLIGDGVLSIDDFQAASINCAQIDFSINQNKEEN
jgi:hypothetical protein